MKEFVAHIYIIDSLKRWHAIYAQKRDYRKKLYAEIMAGLFIFIKIRIHVLK